MKSPEIEANPFTYCSDRLLDYEFSLSSSCRRSGFRPAGDKLLLCCRLVSNSNHDPHSESSTISLLPGDVPFSLRLGFHILFPKQIDLVQIDSLAQ